MSTLLAQRLIAQRNKTRRIEHPVYGCRSYVNRECGRLQLNGWKIHRPAYQLPDGTWYAVMVVTWERNKRSS